LNFAFQRHKRLLKTDDYSSVFNFKRSLTGQYLNISYKPNQCNHARLGVVVAKKLFPTSVERNRIKRLLREIFRLNSSQLKKVDLIVRPRLQVRSIKYTALQDDFLQIVERIKF